MSHVMKPHLGREVAYISSCILSCCYIPSICCRGLQVIVQPLHHKFHNCVPIPKWCVSGFHFCFICCLNIFLDASITQGWFLSYICCGHGFTIYLTKQMSWMQYIKSDILFMILYRPVYGHCSFFGLCFPMWTAKNSLFITICIFCHSVLSVCT